MEDLLFLTLDDVLAIHANQVEEHGGSMGVRDLRLLQSAIAQPEATFGGQFLHGDLFEMAAAYLFHIMQNHPFVDGNKRTGMVAAFTFLRFNGFELDAAEDALESMVLSVASGECDKPEVTAFLRRHTRHLAT